MFVHSGSPFDPITSQLLPVVSVYLDTNKVSFDYLRFEAQMGTADWALALSDELLVQDVFRDATIFYSTDECGPANTVCRVSRESTRVYAEETGPRYNNNNNNNLLVFPYIDGIT